MNKYFVDGRDIVATLDFTLTVDAMPVREMCELRLVGLAGKSAGENRATFDRHVLAMALGSAAGEEIAAAQQILPTRKA